VWVVTAPREAQIERLRRDRGLSETEARQRIDAQPPPEEKLKHATLVIDNGGSLADAHVQVERAFDAIRVSIAGSAKDTERSK
jgi:dephospho-CoA kinase